MAYRDAGRGGDAPMDPNQTQMTGRAAGSLGAGIQSGAMMEKLRQEMIPPTDRQKLEQKRNYLLMELSLVDEGIAALDAHPELEEFTKTLQRALNR